jgi:hypothetical protein
MNMDNNHDPGKVPSAFRHKPPDIIPKFSVYEPIELSVPVDGSVYIEGTYAPQLHIKGYRSKRKTIRVVVYPHEYFELLAPNGFMLAGAKKYVAENGREMYAKLQKMQCKRQTGKRIAFGAGIRYN